MPRRPDQTKDALRKDIDRLDLMIGRAEQNTKRPPDLNRDIINKLSWVRMKLAEESIVTKKAS